MEEQSLAAEEEQPCGTPRKQRDDAHAPRGEPQSPHGWRGEVVELWRRAARHRPLRAPIPSSCCWSGSVEPCPCPWPCDACCGCAACGRVIWLPPRTTTSGCFLW